MGIFRRRKLPAELRPALEREERVLAWTRVGEKAAVVATNLGLFLPGRDARLGWHEIHKAVWGGRQLVVEHRGQLTVEIFVHPSSSARPSPPSKTSRSRRSIASRARNIRERTVPTGQSIAVAISS